MLCPGQRRVKTVVGGFDCLSDQVMQVEELNRMTLIHKGKKVMANVSTLHLLGQSKARPPDITNVLAGKQQM